MGIGCYRKEEMQFLSVIVMNYSVREWMLIFIMLVPQTVADIKYKEISVFPNVIVIIILHILVIRGEISDHIIPMLPGLFFLLLSFTLKESLGGGDGIILILIGCILGFFQAINIMIAACMLSSVYSLFLILIEKKDFKEETPFLPFLFLGTIICGII